MLLKTIITLASGLVAGGSVAGAQPVPMFNEEGTPFFTVEVAVENYGATRMLVDTGASDTVLADWFVKEKNIPLFGDTERGTDSGGVSFSAGRAKVDFINLASTHSGRPGALFVVPVPPPFRQLGIGGIFSPQSFFSGKDVLLDFRHKVILAGPEAAAAAKGMRLADRLKLSPCSKEMGNKYVLKASLNGVKGRFYMDTGGRSAAITREFFAKFKDLEGTKTERIGAGSRREVLRLQNMKLVLKDIAAEIPVDVEPGGVSCPGAQGKLGNDFFRGYALFLNSKRDSLALYQ